jgi:hypothetical protein
LPNFEISWQSDDGVQPMDAGRNSGETARSTVAVNAAQVSLPQSQAGKVAAAKPGAGDKAAPTQAGVKSAEASNPAATGLAANGSGSTGVAGEKPVAIKRPKPEWPFPVTTTVKRLAIQQVVVATTAQSEYALRRGRGILAPYRAETTRLRVVFEVPMGERIGVMIFDGEQDDLAATTVFILDKKPPQQTWIEIDALKGFVVAE